MSVDYRILRSSEECRAVLPEVAKLFSTVFLRPLPLPRWEQFYFRNPYGEPLVILGYDGGELIAHHALIPQILARGADEVLPYMLAISTMIDYRYRDLTVFFRIVDALHKGASAMAVPFIFGFPNAKSLVPFKAFHYKPLFESPLCSWAPKTDGAPEHVEPIQALSAPTTEWSYPADPAYWAWRGHPLPLRRARVNGVLEVAYKGPEDGILTVLDLAASESVAANRALAALARRDGAAVVRLTKYHAGQAGVPASELVPHGNYTVRLTCHELTRPVPQIRFSLLLSDIF
jgi:hypothetical protein